MWFLRSVAQLSQPAVVVATLLPLTFIVVALSVLNLEHAVFEIMGGLRENRTPNDVAYLVVQLLSGISVLAFPVVLTAYGVLVYRARRRNLADGVSEQR